MTDERSGDAAMGRRIQQLRGIRTQQSIVAKMQDLDPDRPHHRAWLSTIELGYRSMHVEDLELLARALGVSADAILGIERGSPLDRLAARYGGRISDADATIVEGLLARLANGTH